MTAIKTTAAQRSAITAKLQELAVRNPALNRAKLAEAIGLTPGSLATYLSGDSFPQGKNFVLVKEFVELPAEEQLKAWQTAISGETEGDKLMITQEPTVNEKILAELKDIKAMLTRVLNGGQNVSIVPRSAMIEGARIGTGQDSAA